MDKATHHDHSHVQSLWLEKSDANVLFQKESQKFVAVTILSFREWERVTRTGWIIWFEKIYWVSQNVPDINQSEEWGPLLNNFKWVLTVRAAAIRRCRGCSFHIETACPIKNYLKSALLTILILIRNSFMGHSHLSLVIIVNDRWSTGRTMMACSMPGNSSLEQLRFFWFRKYHQKRS